MLTDHFNFSAAGSDWGTIIFVGGISDFNEGQHPGLSFETPAAARHDAVSYSVNDNGEVSMTLTNHLDVASSAYFSVSVDLSMTAPAVTVPQPESYLCMLLGLGALGGFARWRAKA